MFFKRRRGGANRRGSGKKRKVTFSIEGGVRIFIKMNNTFAMKYVKHKYTPYWGRGGLI